MIPHLAFSTTCPHLGHRVASALEQSIVSPRI